MLRNRIKNLLADILYHSGLSTLLVRRMFRHRMVVLTYHRVLPLADRDTSFSHAAIMIEPTTFARHLAVLTRHFDCLSLDGFNAAMRTGAISGIPRCLITFDDAWQDNYTYAFDLLKKWHVPAVVFVPTDYIGTEKLFWQERLGHLVERVCASKSADAARLLEKYEWSYLVAIPLPQRREEIKTAIRAIKHKTYMEIDQIIADLTAALNHIEPDYGPDRYLSTEQMREMMRHDITFQSHGCTHRVFPSLRVEELSGELQRSRHWLQEHMNAEPIALAYPNGDHDSIVQRETRQAGYALAFTTIPGQVDITSDPLAIRRININDNVAGSEARLLMALLLSGR